MKVLAIGDIFGKTGREIIKNYLPQLKKKYALDLVIANVENSTHGKGIIHKHYLELKASGIDVMTSGNHIFQHGETKKFIKEKTDLLRPLNSNPYHPGLGSILIERSQKKIRVTNLIGQTFMPLADNPYWHLQEILEKKDWDIHLIDFHAESTAEKKIMAWFLDGKINAMWGTHTHVQTADEKILPKKTGFITDVGMTGPYGGIIGADPELIIQRAKYGFFTKMEPYKDKGQFNGVIFEFNEKNEILRIERINKVF